MQRGTSSTTAPHADIAIPLHFTSSTGMHRVLHCAECGASLLYREGDTVQRLHDPSRPYRATIAGTAIAVMCGNCKQQYSAHLATDVHRTTTQPLYLQVQTVMLTPSVVKTSRYLYCVECGFKFQTFSDRISMVSDNQVPTDMLAADKVAPIGSLCAFKRCAQRWALLV